MPEKQVNLELVSSYVRMFDDKETVVTEHDTMPERFLKRRDWAVGVGYDWYEEESLFPFLDDLDPAHRQITFDVYVLDDKGVRNGKAQSVVWDKFDGEPDHNVVWDAMYKDGKLHGVCKTYNIKRVRKLANKTFFVDGKAVDAKTVAEWRKVQSAMNTKVKSKQIKGR